MERKKQQVRSKKSSGRSKSSVKLVSLSPDQVKHLLKPHSGYTDFVPELVALYDGNPDQLKIAGLSGSDITDAVQAYQDLRAQEVAAERQLQLIQESRLYYSSKAYSLVLEVYARCQNVGRTNVDIKKAIAAFEQFLKRTGKKETKKTSSPPTTPTSGTPPSGSST